MVRRALFATAVLVGACGTLNGVAPGDDGASDASADASIDGAPGTTDGADDVPDVARARFCDAHPGVFLCADFDVPDADVAVGWSSVDRSAADDGGAAGVTLDETASSSAPASMRANILALVGQGEGSRLDRTLPPAAHRVRMSFAMRVDAASAGMQVSVAELFWKNCAGPAFQGEWLVLGNGSLDLFIDGALSQASLATPTLGGPFINVVLDVDWTSGDVRVDVDGAEVLFLSAAARAPCTDKTEFRASLGFGAQSTGSAVAHYDNFVLEIDPP